MINYIKHREYDAIFSEFSIVFLCWIIVMLSVCIDLYFGLQKAKKGGEKIHSRGLRQTFNKTKEYLAFMFFMLFVDIMNPVFTYIKAPSLPLLSISGAILLVYTEWKSVKENIDEKVRKNIENNAFEISNKAKEYREALKDSSKV